MDLRDGALDHYLRDLRRSAGLSVAQVCERTKIQARFIEALEEGRFGAVPSNTHLRAFSLAVAQACGGDPERTAALVRRALAASAVPEAARRFDTPAPPPAEARRPLAPAPEAKEEPAPGGAAPRLAAEGPALAAAPGRGLQAASARLRSLPLALLLALLALAGGLSYAAHRGLEAFQARPVPSAPGPEAAAAPAAPVPAQAPAARTAAAPAAPAPALAVEADAAPGAAGPLELSLRARRDCWLVLEIDGQRLPTVTMREGERLRWPVQEKARLLAGNVGALRVWWRGENLGYLGDLGVRANALVFERGRRPRLDKAQALALPPGVPE